MILWVPRTVLSPSSADIPKGKEKVQEKLPVITRPASERWRNSMSLKIAANALSLNLNVFTATCLRKSLVLYVESFKCCQFLIFLHITWSTSTIMFHHLVVCKAWQTFRLYGGTCARLSKPSFVLPTCGHCAGECAGAPLIKYRCTNHGNYKIDID